ncbi:MAG TPA: hypothetical protein VH560_14900 [Polyangia bacterium]|jgi:hypothetical protein|nr:hypothetical protein [Polyangia bacterium]
MLALVGLAWAVLSTSVAPTPARGPAAPPAAIAGTWEVERVEGDAQDSSRWRFPQNDPRFVGRALVVGPGRVELEGDKELTCQQDAWPTRRSTWARLFAKGFPRVRPGMNPNPTPEDFDVVLPKTAKKSAAVVAEVLCQGPYAAKFPLNHWAAVAPSGELLVHHDTQVLLVLRRRAVDEKPVASFDCAKAATPTEKTICGRADLASWDRSVALAVSLAKSREDAHGAEIDTAQAAWGKQRSACGADANCIEKLQVARVYELVGE